MKNSIILLIFLTFFNACNKSEQKKIKTKPQEKLKQQDLPCLKNNPELEKEKVLIYTDEEADSLIISKNELNKIEVLFPVFKEDFPVEPDEAYINNVWKDYINEEGKKETISFGSEAGEDEFCLVYAYYLKQKNGEEKFKKERETLIKLYRAINELYGHLNYGGTFFGHQYKRLNASAEYSIYLLTVNKERYDKKYDFKKQKKIYIESLIQYVTDEESQNVYYIEDLISNKQKARERAETLQIKIDVLQRLITNYYYLNQVQNFEITYYK